MKIIESYLEFHRKPSLLFVIVNQLFLADVRLDCVHGHTDTGKHRDTYTDYRATAAHAIINTVHINTDKS